jgi:RHS repeat-associated protein
LKQTLPQWQNAEFDVTGWGEELAPAFYFHGDYQNSTVKISGIHANSSYRFGYTPMGQTYGFKHRYSDEQMTRSFSSHSPNRNVVQNLYTGKYAEPLTGLTQMDARWYDAQKGRFIQGDQYNLANLILPKGVQSELLRHIRRSQGNLLRDPAQQMTFGFVSGNPISRFDPTGLIDIWIGGGADGGKDVFNNLPIFPVPDQNVMSSTLSTTQITAPSNLNDNAVLFQHNEADAIMTAIVEALESGDSEINLIGHSYGATTAAEIANDLDVFDISVDNLILLDPVNSFGSFPEVNDNVQNGVAVHVPETGADSLAPNGFPNLLGALVDTINGESLDNIIATAGNSVGSIVGLPDIYLGVTHGQSTPMYGAAVDFLNRPIVPGALPDYIPGQSFGYCPAL